MKYNQEVDKVLIHKTSKEINDNDINDGDTSDTDADNYTATRLASPSINAALSKDTVLYKDPYKKCKYVFSTFLILIFLRNKNESCDPYKKYGKLRNYVSRKTMFLYDFCTVFV